MLVLSFASGLNSGIGVIVTDCIICTALVALLDFLLHLPSKSSKLLFILVANIAFVPCFIAFFTVYISTHDNYCNYSQFTARPILSFTSGTYLYLIFKKYKTFSVLIYSYINTSGNWKNEKLCGNTTPAGEVFSHNFEFFQFSRVLI